MNHCVYVQLCSEAIVLPYLATYNEAIRNYLRANRFSMLYIKHGVVS